MKKLTIYIPDDADKRLLTVFSGQQQVAFKLPDRKSNWYVLKSPCVKCGECCKDDLNPFSDESPCPHLDHANECTLAHKGARPWRCGCDNPRAIQDYCKLEYDEIIDERKERVIRKEERIMRKNKQGKYNNDNNML